MTCSGHRDGGRDSQHPSASDGFSTTFVAAAAGPGRLLPGWRARPTTGSLKAATGTRDGLPVCVVIDLFGVADDSVLFEQSGELVLVDVSVVACGERQADVPGGPACDVACLSFFGHAVGQAEFGGDREWALDRCDLVAALLADDVVVLQVERQAGERQTVLDSERDDLLVLVGVQAAIVVPRMVSRIRLRAARSVPARMLGDGEQPEGERRGDGRDRAGTRADGGVLPVRGRGAKRGAARGAGSATNCTQLRSTA